ncbi:MAG: hypothetical protein A2W31_09765 [Planctomycetes bacterium RBG_16_64_10]|nr:MAG: hypothetical protein A2W31_09765 [Planctomycetes bacterium RBG_16_64_10]
MTGAISTASVLLVASVYWGAGLAAGPAWNTWMGTLVPRPLQTLYFTNRTRFYQCAVLTGFLAGAALLAVGSRYGASLVAFTTIFAAAGLARLWSVGALANQREPEPMPANMRRIAIRDWWFFGRTGSGRQLLLYIVVVQAIVQFAGPYFTPYMLGKLALTYEEYMALIATAFVAKALALPMWGRFAERRGAALLLWIGGVGIVPLSALWIVSSHFAWLLLVQCLAGAIWAAYELAFFLMFFEAIPSSERTGMLTLYNLANSTSWVAGSLLGGCLLYALGTTQAAYFILFGLSSAGRLAALGLLYQVPEIRVRVAPIGIRTMDVRPNAGSIDHPILPSLPNQRTGDLALVEGNRAHPIPEPSVRAA